MISALLLGLPYKAIEPDLRVHMNVSPAHVMEGERVEMAVAITNKGFLRIKDVEVIISTPEALGGKWINWTIGALGTEETKSRHFNISIPPGFVGKYVVDVEAILSQDNELNRRHRSKAASAVIQVHGTPLELRLIPSQVANGSRWNFTAILVNKENVTLVVGNITADGEVEWGKDLVFENNFTTLAPRGEASMKVFEGVSPEAPGVYFISLRAYVRHPDLGDRWFIFKEDLTVSPLESRPSIPMVPSRIYNLISVAIFLFTSVLILNLLLGLDVVD